MESETTTVRRTSARERLLASADELFYEHGINRVGIDRVIEHAGVAKASLYDCFGSKEELIRAYLKRRGDKRQALLSEGIARQKTPRDKILSMFDTLAQVVSRPDYRGCVFQRASAEAIDGSLKSTYDELRGWVRSQFTELAREAEAANPELLGQQLVLLYDGAAATAHLDGDKNAPQAAREIAAKLLG
ncbi:MAG TPA: TetR/AcrR family transcriptional regulator [Steroidobacteraceae bacterium]|nr:TetR/AcrR family transcriptional regulator [Steroidobacteraceae bacterium]